ncbi:uncharacterized protein BJ171DRAFT_539576 [Polychytrium aggregatum]|uniref:uncharacterized protein n=1 Tax=Polychytrium aggregatum TaxID=110093 RepID=UPI0022FDDC1F|nr:uncharacterized protein BJ171DRAFT_574935 [Polychytrium aggregatum]XP_052961766.1 uncharacterized protein BJ171DRAFT_539576 [Polychytrium aggregatum]KAI9190590.1 hypothetical protein BJ171DRAFT_574935 [Polychytrium aggregatum]KAI9190789.1 hypothetical protein BJ171DRAFT_539576 [Polychytrium aggregatum]
MSAVAAPEPVSSAPAPAVGLLELPNELLCHIFIRLPCPSAFLGSCRRTYSLVSDEWRIRWLLFHYAPLDKLLHQLPVLPFTFLRSEELVLSLLRRAAQDASAGGHRPESCPPLNIAHKQFWTAFQLLDGYNMPISPVRCPLDAQRIPGRCYYRWLGRRSPHELFLVPDNFIRNEYHQMLTDRHRAPREYPHRESCLSFFGWVLRSGYIRAIDFILRHDVSFPRYLTNSLATAIDDDKRDVLLVWKYMIRMAIQHGHMDLFRYALQLDFVSRHSAHTLAHPATQPSHWPEIEDIFKYALRLGILYSRPDVLDELTLRQVSLRAADQPGDLPTNEPVVCEWHIGVADGRLDGLRYLIANGHVVTDLYITDAIAGPNCPRFDLATLLQSNGLLLSPSHSSRPWLLGCVRAGDRQLVQWLIEDVGVLKHAPTSKSILRQVLKESIGYGHVDVTEYLISQGASIGHPYEGALNKPIRIQSSDLVMLAASQYHVDMVRWLLERESSPRDAFWGAVHAAPAECALWLPHEVANVRMPLRPQALAMDGITGRAGNPEARLHVNHADIRWIDPALFREAESRREQIIRLALDRLDVHQEFIQITPLSPSIEHFPTRSNPWPQSVPNMAQPHARMQPSWRSSLEAGHASHASQQPPHSNPPRQRTVPSTTSSTLPLVPTPAHAPAPAPAPASASASASTSTVAAHPTGSQSLTMSFTILDELLTRPRLLRFVLENHRCTRSIGSDGQADPTKCPLRSRYDEQISRIIGPNAAALATLPMEMGLLGHHLHDV